ncbi:MAG: GGDEF domain-containing protein [Acidobacteriaceae bacterium]
MRQYFLIPGLLFLLAGPLRAAALPPAPLTSVRQILHLSPLQAGQGLPVRFEGVVTFYEPDDHILFVQDHTASIFVRTRHIFPFIAGDRILVRGVTAGSYHVIVASEEMRVVGKAPLPIPSPATFPQLMTGQWDCDFVRVTGKVLSATMQQTIGAPFLLLQVLMDGGPIDVHMENPGGLDLHRLLDSEVTLTGVSGGRFDGKFQLVGANLYLNSPSEMRITAPALVNPQALPFTSMEHILGSYNMLARSPRLRIQGTVTLYEPGSQLVVENAGKAALVHTHQTLPLNLGQVVDATGFADASDYTQSLSYGQFAPTGEASPIRPEPVEWQDAVAGKYAFNLISIEGRLIDQVHESSQDTLFIDSGGHVFSAVMRHASGPGSELASVPAGSRIRVSGVCFVKGGGAWNSAVDFELRMRTPQDMLVLARASWWTVPHLLYLIAALNLLIVAAVAWGEMLRRRVRQQTRLLRQRMKEEAARSHRQASLEMERGRVLMAINSRLPIDQVLGMITDFISKRLDGVDCRYELASGGAASGEAPPAEGASPRGQCRRDILSVSGERLGALILACDEKQLSAIARFQVLDTGASLAAVAVDNRRLYEGLIRRSEYDQLTEVPNRFHLDSRMKSALESARLEQRTFAVIYIDLNRFKSVNDRFGHRIGDIFLQHVARRLSDKLRGQDTLARIGGDEFVVLIPVVRDRAEAEEIGRRLNACFDSPFRIDGHTIQGSASIGIALYPEDGTDEEQLQRFADSAMYATKHHFAWLGAKEEATR